MGNNEAPAVLKLLEDQVLSVVQKMINDLAQVCQFYNHIKRKKESWGKPQTDRILIATIPAYQDLQQKNAI